MMLRIVLGIFLSILASSAFGQGSIVVGSCPEPTTLYAAGQTNRVPAVDIHGTVCVSGAGGGGGGAVTIASGAVASGAYSSGAFASGAYSSGSVGSGAMVDLGAIADAASTAGGTGTLSAKLRLMTTQLGTINTTLGTPASAANQASQITQETASAAALGTTADAVCSTATGTCTLAALVKFLNNSVTAPSAAIAGTLPTTQTPVATGATSKIQTDLNGNLYLSPTTHGQSAALASNVVLKAGAGILSSFHVSADTTLSAAAWWVMIFDATSLPANGAVTPMGCWAVPSGTTSYSAGYPSPGTIMGTGITVGVSTTGCFTLTASIHAFLGGTFQ